MLISSHGICWSRLESSTQLSDVSCIHDLRDSWKIDHSVPYLPCSTLLFEWFYTRRGLASGILFAGTGVGGAIFPPLVSGLLSRFGYKATMITLGLAFLVLGGIALIPIKRRLPYTRGGGRRHGLGGRFSGQGKFLVTMPMLVASSLILVVGLGNFIPSLWIPSTLLPPCNHQRLIYSVRKRYENVTTWWNRVDRHYEWYVLHVTPADISCICTG